MKILENLKLDTWYGVILYLGVLIIASSFFFDKEFLEEKHLFGLGLGMVLVGISMIMAEKHISIIKNANIFTGGAGLLSTIVIKHNPISIILLVVGIILIGLFGFLLVKGLI